MPSFPSDFDMCVTCVLRRAVWNASCDAVVVGSMKRGVDCFSVPHAHDKQQGKDKGKGKSEAVSSKAQVGRAAKSSWAFVSSHEAGVGCNGGVALHLTHAERGLYMVWPGRVVVQSLATHAAGLWVTACTL